MNKRFLGVLIFAFVVAAGGGFLTYKSLISRGGAATPARPTATIVIASRNLEVGTILKDSDVKLAEWSGAVPVGASNRTADYIGRGVVTPIYSDEPLIESRLAPKGAGGGLAAMIPQGMRAFAVRVNDVVGVAGFVVPGMRVDVVINGNAPGGNDALGTLARTLMQNVEVLSAGQDYKKDAEGKPVTSQVVTLLVTPDDAEKLSLAANQTTIQLVLRNPVDRDVAKVPGSALAYLFNSPGAAKPAVTPPPVPKVVAVEQPAPKPPPFKMEIFAGTKKTETSFENRGEDK